MRIKEENQTLATVTLQNYFRMYEKLAGMTGTAVTEAAELMSTYTLQVVPIPTHRPLARVDQPDLIYRTEEAKFEAVAADIEERSATGQPVLVGTTSVEKSERLSRVLEKRGLPTTCSTPSSTPVRPRWSPRRAVWVRSRSPPTWRAVVSTSSWAAIPTDWPSGSCAQRSQRGSSARTSCSATALTTE
ncbi:MAG: hypothetical protein R2789_09120 [Microthrixaceae bacterium]